MAIRLEFINLIIPIENIDKHYPGGFDAFISYHRSMFGRTLWHDDYLFREGVMDPMDMQSLIDFWEKKGLMTYEELYGKKYWKDICVVDTYLGTTHPCSWLEEDVTDRSIYLKGKPKGRVNGREEMKATLGK